MPDHLTPEQRSRAMSLVRGKDTTPEIAVRKMVHRMGYRFRLHRKDLPGKPDLVFPRLKKAVFVHGCFWHGHRCKRLPTSNVEYWREKIETNQARDLRNNRDIRKLGWKPLVIWECEVKCGLAEGKIRRFLEDT